MKSNIWSKIILLIVIFAIALVMLNIYKNVNNNPTDDELSNKPCKLCSANSSTTNLNNLSTSSIIPYQDEILPMNKVKV